MMSEKRRHRWVRIILAWTLGIFLLVSAGIGFAIMFLSDEGFVARILPEIPKDDTPPVVNLKGETEMKLLVGRPYEDPGVDAYDYYNEIEVSTEGSVDTNTVGEYEIKYHVVDEVGNATDGTRKVEVVPEEKIVYLTFDDGPGDYTAALLDVLKKYNVKATFFVTGHGADDLIKREYEEGHAVGLHSLSHNYSYIYANADNFWADLTAVQERVKNLTGHTSYLMRFPGGSSNTVSARYDGKSHIMSRLTKEVEQKGFTYFDWNILSGDAGEVSTSDEVYNNVVNALKPDHSVVLQHDIKSFSVEAVERIIQYGLENGYTFLPLDKFSFTAHHGVNN